MKHKIGNVMMILGCVLLAAALLLFFKNRQEQEQAAAASQEAISKVVEVIRDKHETESTLPEPAIPPRDREMIIAEIDGYGYIGFLGLPGLELELPVMADWTYPQLQIAPCRYTGTTYADNLVIMAHNYPKHFGGLKDMERGALVTFTDMEGETTRYQVVALEILPPDSVEDVTSGSFALTLFTCTYGGENRVVLRCDRMYD